MFSQIVHLVLLLCILFYWKWGEDTECDFHEQIWQRNYIFHLIIFLYEFHTVYLAQEVG